MAKFCFDLRELTISNRNHSLMIEGINFTLEPPHRSMSLLADSGIGKTTIFKSLFSKYIELWSIEKPFRFECKHSYNKYSFDNKDIQKNRIPISIGFASQFPYFLESQTGYQNIFAPLKWRKINWSEEEKEKHIELFCLQNIASRQLSILSGGERQLINIARMMVLSPSIAIIDECFSSMNEQMAHTHINILKDKFPNTLFLITSHRTNDINSFSGKSLSLKRKQYKSGKFFVTQE